MRINKFLSKPILLFISFTAMVFILIWALDTYENTSSIDLDFSFNKYSTISEESRDALKSIKNKVSIYTTSSNKDKQLNALLNNYSNINNNIDYKVINIAENPSFTNKFKSNSNNQLRNDSIVVYSPETEKFRILNPEEMLSYGFNINSGNYQIEGLKYEKNITEAIINVSSLISKKIYFLGGHGEKDKNNLSHLIEYLKSNGYNIEYLRKLDKNLEKGSLLAIISPQSDIDDEELVLIKEFENQSGSILFTMDYTDNIIEKNNLSSLLKSYGIMVKYGTVLADIEDKQSYYKEPINIIPYMLESDLLSPLISSGKDILLMTGSKAFELDKSDLYSSFPLLKSGKTARLLPSTDSNTVLESGEFTLSAYTEKINPGSNISRLIVIGNSDTICNEYLASITFSSEFTQTILNALLPEQAISIDIAVKPAFRKQLLPISKAVGISVIIIIPILILIYSLVVIRKRKSL